jgi:pectinesterase
VQKAIMSVPSGSPENPVVIHIAPGTYHELLYIQHEKRFFKLVGENPTNTILTYNLYAGLTNFDGHPIGTFRTPTFTLDADDFTAENLTFENAAGPVGQALAIRVDSDRASFRNCRFLGWQDTMFLNTGRQYFENCYIAGHVDFIFGAAAAWFEKCHIHCLGKGYIAAASTEIDQPYGFVFSHCSITGSQPDTKTFLGRPWRIHASTIYLNCEMSDVVQPEGWNDWNKPVTHQTARYVEYNNTGPGASPTNRPAWIKQLTPDEAKAITVKNVLGGADEWNPTEQFNVAKIPLGADYRNLSYGEAGGQKLLLDAHVPAGNGPFPVLLIVHGGGWCAGDKEGDLAHVLIPAITNFTWFSINYRLAPAHRWPACYDDVLTAIRWVKAHAPEFKGDPARIALIGYSAGGHLVTLAGTCANADTRVQAIVGCAPPTEITRDAKRRGSLEKWISMKYLLNRDVLDDQTLKLMDAISPVNQVQPGLPPFLLVQGSADKTVPYDQTMDFAAKLKTNGVPHDLIVIKDGQHRIRDWQKFHPGWAEQVAAWLQTHLGAANQK